MAALLAVAVSLALSAAAPAQVEDSRLLPGSFELDVEAGLLTLEAHDAPLSDVVRAIGERVGYETILVGDLPAAVNTSFKGVPVGDGLERLLRDIDRVVLYGPAQEGSDNSAVSQIWLFGPGGPAESTVAGAAGLAARDDLEQTDERIRADAVLRLASSYPVEQALERLARALREDEDAFVRSRAAAALGALQDDRAVPALESALEDEHDSVRMQAIQALGRIGGERATTALGDVLLYGTERKQRIQAAWALGRQDTEIARRILDTVADDPDELVSMASRKPPGRARAPALEAQTDAERRGSDTIR